MILAVIVENFRLAIKMDSARHIEMSRTKAANIENDIHDGRERILEIFELFLPELVL
jgi:hypothetical protein